MLYPSTFALIPIYKYDRLKGITNIVSTMVLFLPPDLR